MHENGQVEEDQWAEVGEGSVETRAHRVVARPHAPTKAELAEHYPLRLNYGSWCADCVHGRAASAHHRPANQPREGVTWSMDYCFLGEACQDDDGGKREIPILAAYDF